MSSATVGPHTENAANRANYEEIDGHLRIIKAKLAKTNPDALDGPHEQLVGDLEDYYERRDQMRQYRITTLEEELKESSARIGIATGAVRTMTFRMAAVVFVTLVVAAGCVAEIVRPGTHAGLIAKLPLTQIATHCTVAAVAAAACYIAVRATHTTKQHPLKHD
tara:strand:- start:207 stop:698 length:492 start_codon:yes stop_codon:yes gene_type:complete